jgi:hypothetical protein
MAVSPRPTHTTRHVEVSGNATDPVLSALVRQVGAEPVEVSIRVGAKELSTTPAQLKELAAWLTQEGL